MSHGSGPASVTLSGRVFPDRGAIRGRQRKGGLVPVLLSLDAELDLAGDGLDFGARSMQVARGQSGCRRAHGHWHA